jgi:signal transduction histidine kinase
VTSLWWTLLGIVVGAAAMLPLVRLLLRRAEQRARDAERRALESERMAELGAMTGGLAHEIKNPLSTIGLNAQLLAEGVADASMPEDERTRLTRRLDALGREVERLSGILTDFLQFAGRLQLDPQPHDLVRLVEDLSDFYHPQCDRAGIVLRTQVPAEPIVVRIDEGLAKQAILNLLVNATQSMEGAARDGETAELLLRVEGDGEQAMVHVTDTGPGIAPERLEEIFHPFVSGKSGGTGLGLPTTRRIVQAHDGTLEVHSEVGRGTEFVIKLPLGGG